MTPGVLFLKKDNEAFESRYITHDGVYSVAQGEMRYKPFSKPEQFVEHVEAYLLMHEWWELVEGATFVEHDP